MRLDVAMSGDSPHPRTSASVGMGRSLLLRVRVTPQERGLILLPFVNGRRWGAHAFSAAAGQAMLILPLPVPGPVDIQVLTMPADGATWLGLADPDLLMVGRRVPTGGMLSNVVHAEVMWRDIPPRPSGDTLFCMQWEPWFTTGIGRWRTAQAVPLVGCYDSFHPDVIRQHMLWMMELGVDFLLPDWSNHIWGCRHWDERSDGVNAIVHATQLALEVLAQMRDEGLPVPRVALMPGLSNGPPATMTALNEELNWIYHTLVRNPRFHDLWQMFDGKPLVVVLDTAAIACPEARAEAALRIPFFAQTLGMSAAALDAFRVRQEPVDARHFTVRWMSSQNQTTRHHELGYWSWMDGVLHPPVTYRDGRAEAVTVTPAFFNALGWTGPQAHGRRGGTTFLETFRVALQHRPRVVLLHQFNEFTGQPEGHGYGPERAIYVDTYSVELSDDLEPVSFTAPGYRGAGGWGYYYLNLTRALLDLYRGEAADSTLLAVGQPLRGAILPEKRPLAVSWTSLGVPPTGFTVALDGQTLARVGPEATGATVAAAYITSGQHQLTVTAEGVRTRYPLSRQQLDEPSESARPVVVSVPFTVRAVD